MHTQTINDRQVLTRVFGFATGITVFACAVMSVAIVLVI